MGGVAAGDEAVDAVGAVQGEDEAVAESVDETAVAGAGGQSGGEEFVVGGAVAAQVVDQGGPAGWGVSDGEHLADVVEGGGVGAEAFGEVGGCPGARVVAGEEVHCVGVEVQDP